MILSEAWAAYEADKRIEGYSPHTLQAYKIQSNLLIRRFGDVELEALTLADFKNYLAEVSQFLKKSSVGHRVRFIKSLCRWAVDDGLLDRNPAAKLKEPKQGPRVPKTLAEEDIERLREACTKPREHAIIEFMYSTGCRIGEIATLNKSAINWDDRSVIVLGKGDKEREVYFSMRCMIWLKWYLQERTDDDQSLFVTERAPHRISIAQMRCIVKGVAKRAKLETNVYPHRLRHSYATHLLNRGAPLEGIQSLMGHVKIETTKVYVSLSGERRKELYRKYF